MNRDEILRELERNKQLAEEHYAGRRFGYAAKDFMNVATIYELLEDPENARKSTERAMLCYEDGKLYMDAAGLARKLGDPRTGTYAKIAARVSHGANPKELIQELQSFRKDEK